MKKLYKVGILAILINSVIGIGIVVYIATSIVSTSFKETDIGIIDVVNLSTDKANKLEKNMIDNSSKMGINCAKKVEGVLSMFVMNKNNPSEKLDIPYPYGDPSDKIKAASDEGIKEGLKLLEQTNTH